MIPVQYKYAAIAAAWLSSIIVAYFFGRHVFAGEEAEKQHQIAVAYANEVLKRQSAADDLAKQLEQERAKQKPKDRIIYRDVIRYETITPTTARVMLDGRWRLLHDAAASGIPADTTSLSSGDAEPVSDAKAIETVSINYETCRGWREQVIGWQRWYEIVAKKNPG